MLTDRQMTVAAGFLFLLVVLAWQLMTTSAGAGGGVAVDCNASTPGVQSACTYPSGASFEVQVQVTSAPTGGFFAHQMKLRWDDSRVNYLPTQDALEENRWPLCAWSGHVDNRAGQPPDASVLYACVPMPVPAQGDTMTGPIMQLRFQCRQDGTSSLTLVPRDGDPQLGSHFLDGGLQPLDPSRAGASVTCGQATNTPPPPPTKTSTPVPTATKPAPAPFESTPKPTATVAPEATAKPTATAAAKVKHDLAIVDQNRRRAGIQIGTWSHSLRVPLGRAAGGTKNASVTVMNRGDHGDTGRVTLRVLGLPEGCFVDGDNDGLPDGNAGAREVTLAPGARATLSFPVTIECHAPRRAGDRFRVELRAEVEHVGPGESAGALANNAGSAQGDVRVVSP
jgi:hypothetical protein